MNDDLIISTLARIEANIKENDERLKKIETSFAVFMSKQEADSKQIDKLWSKLWQIAGSATGFSVSAAVIAQVFLK